MKSEQLKQFELYAEAVGAERYRVTSIKMQADGRKQTFILDKKDGITRGFTPQEIEQRTPEMLRLAQLRLLDHLIAFHLTNQLHSI
nr:truncated RepB fusion protein [Pseudomonas aeruginosa]